MQRVAQCSSEKEVAQKIWTMESDDQQLNTYCVVWWMLDGEEEEQSKCERKGAMRLPVWGSPVPFE